MTTVATSTRIRHDSDATFREWALEIDTMLLATSITATTDTGQINFATVLRPAVNTMAGYRIYKFNDTPAGTAPIVFRIDFGTGFSGTAPLWKVTVGTGSNGSGTITGTALSISKAVCNESLQSTDTARNSYLCANQGFLGINWKQGTSSEGLFIICRTCDSSGVPDDIGAMLVWGVSNSAILGQTQAMRYAATAVAFTARTTQVTMALGINPQAVSSTTVGSDKQVFLGWTISPRVSPLFGVCGCLDSEFAAPVTFSIALVGSTPRTYLALTQGAGPFTASPSGGADSPKFAMLWE